MQIPDDKYLWTEFSPADSHTWKAQILQDIKKATTEENQAVYENKMQWKTYEGVTIKPFYTQEDLLKLAPTEILKTQQSWQNRQYIGVRDAKEANAKAIDAIGGGADALFLDFSDNTSTSVNFSQLLQNIKISDTPVSFQFKNFSLELFTQLKGIAPYQWKGSLFYDPLAEYLPEKNVNPATAFDSLAQAVLFTKDYPNFRALTVSGHHFHQAGASAVQELAFLLNTFVEYAHQLTDRGVAVQDVFNSTELSLSVSTNYFVEIAKLRALQLLWQQLATAYQVKPGPAYIHARTALWNKSSSDAYNNMIRTTIEAMAATLGGTYSLTVLPYNLNPDDVFAARIARNVSVILKEESYFDKVLNVASGSYYIEHLTYTFAAEAWQLFQTIESIGGFIQGSNNGFIHEQVVRVRAAREADLQSGKRVWVGVNKYAPELSEPGLAL
jgi:methylmalonyl-CoA mutase